MTNPEQLASFFAFENESVNLEFKRELDDRTGKKNLLRTIVAFANTAGGTIIIGVEDKTHEIVGVDPEQAPRIIDDLTNAICDACTPTIAHTFNMLTVDDKLVIKLRVFPGSETPYYVKSLGQEKGTYVRVNSTTRPADEYWLRELQLSGVRRSFDQQMVPGADALTEEDIQTFCDFLYEEALKNAGEKSVRVLRKQDVKNWGIVIEHEGVLFPTHAYFLLMGKHPTLQSAAIQCARYPNNDLSTFLDRKIYTGSLFEQFHKTFDWIVGILQMRSAIIEKTRTDFFELPLEAIREILTNALCHRSYVYDGAAIKISVLPDRLEVTSPGPLPTSITVENLMEGYTFFRNPAIAAAFKYVGLIEQWGSGLPRVVNLMRIWGLPKPLADDMGAAVKLTLYRPNDQWPTPKEEAQITHFLKTGTVPALEEPVSIVQNDDSSQKEQLLGFLEKDPSLSIIKLANKMESTAAIVRGLMEQLKTEGRISRVGSVQKGFWKVH